MNLKTPEQIVALIYNERGTARINEDPGVAMLLAIEADRAQREKNTDTLPLDPKPWVHHYDPKDRAETNDLPGNLRDLKPRPGYSQNPEDYA